MSFTYKNAVTNSFSLKNNSFLSSEFDAIERVKSPIRKDSQAHKQEFKDQILQNLEDNTNLNRLQ